MRRFVTEKRILTGARLAATALFLGGTLAVTTGAQAQDGHMDGLIFQDGGQVQLGQIDVDCFSGVGDPGCSPNGTTGRVYEAELLETGTSPGLVGAADEPGFFSIPDGGEAFLPYGDNLPGNAAHSIDLILDPRTSPVAGASILFWDGTGGTPTWSGVPNSEYFEIFGNGGSGGVMDGTSVLSGVVLDSTGANGSFDTHPDFFLYGNGGTVDPTIGFYVVFGITKIAGLADSVPWGAVFDFGVENEVLHEAAIDSIASTIPEPGTGLLVGLGLMGLGVRGRRRRAL